MARTATEFEEALKNSILKVLLKKFSTHAETAITMLYTNRERLTSWAGLEIKTPAEIADRQRAVFMGLVSQFMRSS